MSKKITFTLPAEIVAEANGGILLGDFNNWDYNYGIDLKKQKDGSLKASVTLDAGKTYQYRFLLNDGRWVNDQSAENFVAVEGLYVENCVITVPLETEEATPVAEAKLAKTKSKSVVVEEEIVAAPVFVSEATADDLTKIEGIGKKIAELLLAENIITYKDLGKATAKRIKTILDAAGSKFAMHDPATWPKQSKLAAAGKWDELKKLQDELKGGK